MATTTNSFDSAIGPQVRERGRAQRRGFGVLFGLLLEATADVRTWPIAEPRSLSYLMPSSKQSSKHGKKADIGNGHCAERSSGLESMQKWE